MRVFVAFIISLLIYALLLWLFIANFSNIKVESRDNSEHVIKIVIEDIPKPPKPKVKELLSKKTIVKRVETPKPVVKKVILKEKPVKKVEKRVVKKVIKKAVVPKKTITRKTIIKKPKIVKLKREIEQVIEEEVVYTPVEEEILYMPDAIIQKPIAEKSVMAQSDDLSSFFSTPTTSTNSSYYPNSKIKKLYGSSFHGFTTTQKRFIEDNLETIQTITQRTLNRRGYPEGAGDTGQEGTNVVMFNLHPNGNISNLRLKTRIGYRALDENTLSLIRVAYKDYPYPETTTEIIFYVTYSIYGY